MCVCVCVCVCACVCVCVCVSVSVNEQPSRRAESAGLVGVKECLSVMRTILMPILSFFHPPFVHASICRSSPWRPVINGAPSVSRRHVAGAMTVFLSWRGALFCHAMGRTC
eukprot:GHVU01049569.1.p1 GENE.GHVU01049569.1~~GHVU01049569.1.p1  ORF type:complete len:111 (-),score=1.00 GHVU01049569.1:661-993(-)